MVAMPKAPIPAPGFVECHGRRPPGWASLPQSTKFYAQIRGGSPETEGFVDPVPWTLERANFRHSDHPGDIVGARLVE